MSNEITNLYVTGKEHYEKGEMIDALMCFEKLFKLSKGFADARNFAGLIYQDRGQHDKAIECFKTAIKLNPNYTEVTLNLAVTYMEMGEYDKAKEVEQSAQHKEESVDPFVKGKIANMHAELGDTYAGIGFQESAIDEYKKSLNLRPEFVDVRTKLGNMYRDKGDYHNAIRQLSEAKTYRPDYTPAVLNLGIVYYSQGEIEQAKSEWQAVLKLDSKNKLANMYLNLVN